MPSCPVQLVRNDVPGGKATIPTVAESARLELGWLYPAQVGPDPSQRETPRSKRWRQPISFSVRRLHQCSLPARLPSDQSTDFPRFNFMYSPISIDVG